MLTLLPFRHARVEALAVPGSYEPAALPAPASTTTSGEYAIRMRARTPRRHRKRPAFDVTRDGRKVEPEPYLGARGHLERASRPRARPVLRDTPAAVIGASPSPSGARNARRSHATRPRASNRLRACCGLCPHASRIDRPARRRWPGRRGAERLDRTPTSRAAGGSRHGPSLRRIKTKRTGTAGDAPRIDTHRERPGSD